MAAFSFITKCVLLAALFFAAKYMVDQANEDYEARRAAQARETATRSSDRPGTEPATPAEPGR